MKYLCIKTLKMMIDTPGEYVAFTQGKTYTGKLSATPGGDRCIAFTNDRGYEHLMSGKFLREYLTRICPECEQANVTFIADDYLCDNCVLNNLK